MATRPKGYGLTRELADKINAKYSIEDEQEIIAWLCDITNVDGPNEEGPEAFRQWLSDGTILCALMDVLQPGICKRPHDVSKIKLQALRGHKANENISFFLQAAQNYGVPSSNLFQTVDLTDGQNMAQVQTGLYNIGSMAQKKKFEGPVIGAKMADENRRDFSEATLQAGKNIISLQYRHVRGNILSVERSIGWRRAPGDAYGSTWDWDSDGYNGCEQSDIDDNIESSYARINEVISGIGTFPSHYTVTNIENHPSVHFTSHWCFGTKTFEIDTTGVTSFTHTGSGCCTIPFSTDTGSVAQGNFGFKATVNDVANSAPRFAARPIWVIMKGCVDQKYHVGVTDEDDVRCRWGDSSEAYNFQYDPANMQSFSLDEENCVVTYHPEFDEQGPSNKPIALQVEDFDSDGNLLHSVPLIFIVVTFEPDMDSIRGDMIPEGDKLYAGIFPDHDEEHDHSRRRRQTVTQPDYCTNSPSISVRDDLTDEQQKYFTWINLSQGPDCYPWLCAGRKRRNTDDDENPNLITITWTASYKLGNQTFYDFPRYQFSMPDGMECSAFDDKGEATCTWTPTAAQAIQRDHAHCAEVYDPYGRVSDRQCMTIILEVEACPVGYQHALSSAETAVVCADINECLSDDACGANSSCENNEGGYECICDDGYIKDDDNECIWPPMAYSDAVRTLKEWIEMTSDVLEDHNRVGKFTLRTGKLARNAFNSIQKNCKSPYNEEKYESNDFAIWDRDHDRSDDHCTQATQIKEGFQAFIDNYSCTDGKKAKQVKRVSKFIEKITNPYC